MNDDRLKTLVDLIDKWMTNGRQALEAKKQHSDKATIAYLASRHEIYSECASDLTIALGKHNAKEN